MSYPVLVPLGELPVPSTDFTHDPDLHLVGVTMTIPFEYFRDDQRYNSSVIFTGVRAHAHRTESSCTAWHVRAYDTICEVIDSPWLAEIEELSNRYTNPFTGMRHFLLYIDSAGAYEVIATNWEITPETLSPKDPS